MKRNGGITLTALVVTIVVLLILAGITIGYVLSDNSIFKQAEEAKLQTDIKSWQERLELAKNPNIIEGLGNFNPDKYFEEIERQKIINNKDKDVKDNGDGTYQVTTKPGYVFEVELIPNKENPKDIEIEYIGKIEELAPTIESITVIEKNSNSITVEVTVNRLEDGKLKYYYKKDDEDSYHELEGKQNTTDLTAQFTGLEQNKIYHIKVVVENKKGNDDAEISEITGELRVGTITQKGQTVWANEKASIELETNPAGLTIEYQINDIEGNWLPYGGKIGNLNHKDKIYARITDGVNHGNETYIEIRDGGEPTVTVSKGTVTTNSIQVSVTSNDAEWGMPTSPTYSYFIKKSTDTDYPTTASGTSTGTGANGQASYTFTRLTQNTSYDIRVTTKDKAENEGTGTLASTKTGTVGGASGDLATGNITASSPTWNSTSHTASITLSTTTDLQIQWQKNGIDGTWTTVVKGTKSTTIASLNHNDKIYARLYDGVNAGSEAYVQVKDGTVPTNATITLGATTANTGVNVTAKVTHNDAQSGPKIASCKWVYNTTSGKIGTTVSSYTGGTFTSNGQTINLKATAPGTYYLHVLTTDNAGNVLETVSSAITVKQLATGITVSPTTATLIIGATKQLAPTVTPTNTSNKGVTYTTSSSTIATVSSTGLITAKAVGTATITIKTADGSNKTATCSVTVKEPTVSDIAGQTQTSNKTVKDKNGNKVVIPGGFKVVQNGTGDVTYNYDPNHTPCVQDGIVIEDGEENQFVWIPVGTVKNKDGTTTTITLGRYQFYVADITPTLEQNATDYSQKVTINSYYQELTSNSEETIAAKSLSTFVSKTNSNGGYYLGRYEASYKDSTHCYSKKSTSTRTRTTTALTSGMLWNYLSQETAAKVSRNSFTSSYVDSDLMNSYSWDTALVFIREYSGNTKYYTNTSINTSLANTGANGDKVCNIHDMASNCREWTTEHCTFNSNNSCVSRAGSYSATDRSTVSRQMWNSMPQRFDLSFRSILYLK